MDLYFITRLDPQLQITSVCFICQYFILLQEDDVSQSVRRAQSIIDPSFIVYKQCLFVSIIVLSVAATLCVVFEFIRKPLKKRFFPSKKTCSKCTLHYLTIWYNNVTCLVCWPWSIKAPVTRYRITLVPDYFSHRLGVPVPRPWQSDMCHRGKITPFRM